MCVLGPCIADAHGGGVVAGLLCRTYSLRRLAINGTLPATKSSISVAIVEIPGSETLVPWARKRITHPNGYVMIVATNYVRHWDWDKPL